MKSDQIKEITDRAAEQLVAALQAGKSEAPTEYLKPSGDSTATACTTHC